MALGLPAQEDSPVLPKPLGLENIYIYIYNIVYAIVYIIYTP